MKLAARALFRRVCDAIVSRHSFPSINAFIEQLECRRLLRAPFVVNTASDVTDANDGLTTLREAIAYADTQSGDSTITFDANAFPAVTGVGQTITLDPSQGSLDVGSSSGTITIVGPSARSVDCKRRQSRWCLLYN